MLAKEMYRISRNFVEQKHTCNPSRRLFVIGMKENIKKCHSISQ